MDYFLPSAFCEQRYAVTSVVFLPKCSTSRISSNSIVTVVTHVKKTSKATTVFFFFCAAKSENGSVCTLSLFSHSHFNEFNTSWAKRVNHVVRWSVSFIMTLLREKICFQFLDVVLVSVVTDHLAKTDKSLSAACLMCHGISANKPPL